MWSNDQIFGKGVVGNGEVRRRRARCMKLIEEIKSDSAYLDDKGGLLKKNMKACNRLH